MINTSDPRNPSIIAEFFAGTGVASIAISPDGKTLATVNQLGGIVLWDTSQWSFNMLEWPEISEICRDLGFSPDQKELVVITERYILIYDSNNDFGNDPIILELDDSVQSAFSDMKFSPDGTQLAVGRYDGVIQIWDMNNLNNPPHIIESTKDFSEIEWLH